MPRQNQIIIWISPKTFIFRYDGNMITRSETTMFKRIYIHDGLNVTRAEATELQYDVSFR